MDNSTIFSYIQNNPDVLLDKRRLGGVIKDLFANEPAKVSQLNSVLDLGIIDRILSEDISDSLVRQRIVDLVKNNTGYSEEIAKWVVNTWLSFVGNKAIIKSYDEYKKQGNTGTANSAFAVARNLKQVPNRVVDEPFKVTSGYELIQIKNDKVRVSDHILAQTLYIPCGNSKNDSGFYIKGVNESEDCLNKFSSIFAVIFGILQRSLLVRESKYLKDYMKNTIHRELDYTQIYRYEMMILLMIKNNYISNGEVYVNYAPKDEEAIVAALNDINNYATILAHLSNIDYEPLKINRGGSIKISVDESADIYTEDRKGDRESNERYVWCEKNLIFSIDINDDVEKGMCEFLLEDLFGYKSFRPGQLETIVNILNDNRHKVCIMPTGSGKSLIYYYVAMMHSCPTFIVSPTEILIEDQINNLKTYHGIDDASGIVDDGTLIEFYPANKLLYLTPTTFMSRDLILRLIRLNHKKLIGNVVLDEVHCISNWSHDFRSEYLMLSYNLKEFVDKTGFLCFSATANYTVIRDIMYQLELEPDQILSPIELAANRIKFHLEGCDGADEIYSKASEQFEKRIGYEERTICFTKSESSSDELYSLISEDAKDVTDVYTKYNGFFAYAEFAEEKQVGLIADSDMGVGINLPNIRNTFHVGIPVSKSQFVQEIGRAGRNGGNADSYIYYQKQDSIDNKLFIRRNAPTGEIMEALKFSEKNDIADTMRFIFEGVVDREKFQKVLFAMLRDIILLNDSARIALKVNDDSSATDYMKCLYMLFRMGVISGWYIIDVSKNDVVDFFVSPYKEKDLLEYSKKCAVSYLRAMGDFNRSIRMIKNAKNIEEIIKCYIEWYYDHFLYHHREQVLEMHEFLHHYANSDDEAIYEAIKSYFSLSLMSVNQTESSVRAMSIRDIVSLAKGEGNFNLSNMIEDVRRSNENEYHYKLDFLLFCFNAERYNEIDTDRLSRIVDGCSKYDRIEVMNHLKPLYEIASLETRLEMISILCRYYSLEEVTDHIYAENDDAITIITILCFNQKWGM